jgi:hypothetical protein
VKNILAYSQLPHEQLSVAQRWLSLAEFGVGSAIVIGHNGFVGGHAVLGAGEWQVENGQLKIINGKSGHYQPGYEQMINTLTIFQQNGVDLNTVQMH